MHLDDLPPEILLQISNSISAQDIIKNLILVSKKFNSIFSNILFWKSRCSQLHGINYSIVEEIRSSRDSEVKCNPINGFYKYPPTISENIDWKQSCWERESLYELWPKIKENFYHYKTRQNSAIDVIKLINNGKTCVTGSRDRSILIYNVMKMKENIEDESSLEYQAIDAHKGWIWTLSFLSDNKFCSGGWDSWLKIWDLNQGCKLHELQAIKCESAILCSEYASPGLIAVGMYHKTVKLLDPRTFPIVQTPSLVSSRNLLANRLRPSIEFTNGGPLSIPLHAAHSDISRFDPFSVVPRHTQRLNHETQRNPFTMVRSMDYCEESTETVYTGEKDVTSSAQTSVFPALYSNDKKLHSGPVLCLAVGCDRHILITGSEDKTLHISDLRFLKIANELSPTASFYDDEKSDNLYLERDIMTTLEESRKSPIKSLLKIPLDGIPLTISYDSNCLWVGDDQANIYLFDPANNFHLVGKYYSGHAYSIRNIKHTSPGCGMLFTCSADKSFKVFDATWPPKLVYSQKMCLESEMASLDYINGILAVASADGAVNIWKPKRIT